MTSTWRWMVVVALIATGCGSRSTESEAPSAAPAAAPEEVARENRSTGLIRPGVDPGPSAEPPPFAETAPPVAAPSPDPVSPSPAPVAVPQPSSREVGSASPRDRAKIFLIGHSLVNHDLPRMLNLLSRSAGRHASVRHQVINGAPLRIGWDDSSEAEGESARRVLPGGEIDVLVMTEAIPLENHLEWSDPVRYAGNFVDLARRANPNLVTYIYETWHSRDDRRWRRRIDTDRAGWASIADGVMASRPGQKVYLIPAGRALGVLHDRIEAGSVPGIRRVDDLFADDIHLSDAGNYFVALVHYATIFRRSPVGLTTVVPREYEGRYATPSAEGARVMQEIAWEVVRSDPRSGLSER